MRAFSSHRDHRSSKMRFLIVSAILACAAAAPSNLLSPVAVAGVPALPVAYPAAIPTLSPGDVQAAFIDAQVKAQDQAIAAADKARELNEQASEGLKDKIVVGSDIVKANTEENFWSVQDKQWQALDALKTAQAQLDGAIASSAPVIAKNAVLGPYVAAVSPISPIVYTPGFVAPAVNVKSLVEPAKVEEAKTAETQSIEEAKPEEKNEALTKSAEENKDEKDSVTIEASTKNLEAKPQLAPFVAPIAIQPYGYPIVAPVALSPVLNYNAYPQVGLAPTIVKTGDVQAAFIDAQVKAQDQAIAAADKARELNEQVSENLKDKIVVASDIVKANTEENFWSVQDKQWQALDALKTAQAQLDGAIASSAPAIAKNAVLGPYVAAVSPISPIVYTPGFVAPAVNVKSLVEPAKAEEAKTAEAQPIEEAKLEEKNDALTKAAEENKEEKDSVMIEASTKNLKAKPQLAPFVAPIAIQPYGYPIVAPVALSPVLNYNAYNQVGLSPTIVKTGW